MHYQVKCIRGSKRVDATKLVIQPYQAALNVTPAFLSSTTPASRAAAIARAILSFADNNGFHETPRSFTIGVYSASFRANPAKVGGQTDPFTQDSGVFHHASEEAIAVVQDSGRPLAAVAHEVSHLCGRQHASAASRNAAGVVIPTGAHAPFESGSAGMAAGRRLRCFNQDHDLPSTLLSPENVHLPAAI